MEYNEIDAGSNWGKEAESVNANFQKTGVEIKKLWNRADDLFSGQVTLGKVNSLTELYTPNIQTNERTSPQKGDRWIVLDQINQENDLPYYFVYKGNSEGQTGNIPSNWANTGETITGADAVSRGELSKYAVISTEQGILVRTPDGTIPEVDTSSIWKELTYKQDNVTSAKDITGAKTVIYVCWLYKESSELPYFPF